jgi:hypothetical protein
VLDYRRQPGAERCPPRAELEAQVRDILGRSPFARKAPRTVRCVLRADGTSLAARVQLVDGRSGRVLGVRELSGAGPGCEELGGAVAFAIALAIDPLARPPRPAPVEAVTATPPMPVPVGPSRPPATTLAPAPASPSPSGAAVASSAAGAGGMGVSGLVADAGPLAPLLVPLALAPHSDAGRPPPPADAGITRADAGTAVADGGAPLPDAGARPVDAGVVPQDAGSEDLAPEAAVAPAASEPPRSGWRLAVGVDAVGAAGVLPGFAGGALVHAGAASSTASVELEGRWLPGTTRAVGTGSVSTSLVSGALVGCARFGSWSACGVALAGPVSGKGAGFAESQDASAWMVSAGARGQWEWLFADPVGLRLHLDGAVNLVRPRFLVDSEEAWAVPPVSVWVGGGLFGRF